ncbi:MAG: helix-turn-helix transcriptional regulator [Ruminococcaceae bacterium]|nr:helix-turn-helix transcriptional regulator [Oscillospiraceae bacterium]
MRNYLVTLRKEKNLTQKQLAKKLDISESYYNQIENGERQKRMDITVIDRLSKALGIPASDIIRYESEIKGE